MEISSVIVENKLIRSTYFCAGFRHYVEPLQFSCIFTLWREHLYGARGQLSWSSVVLSCCVVTHL